MITKRNKKTHSSLKLTDISLDKYQKHWIHTRPYGHDIVIFSEPNSKMVIRCKWPDKGRSKDGRVYDTRR
jgi:hypothetical protein